MFSTPTKLMRKHISKMSFRKPIHLEQRPLGTVWRGTPRPISVHFYNACGVEYFCIHLGCGLCGQYIPKSYPNNVVEIYWVQFNGFFIRKVTNFWDGKKYWFNILLISFYQRGLRLGFFFRILIQSGPKLSLPLSDRK